MSMKTKFGVFLAREALVCCKIPLVHPGSNSDAAPNPIIFTKSRLLNLTVIQPRRTFAPLPCWIKGT